jgi:hypothetical protein
MPKVTTEKQKKRAGGIVLLKDLAPRKEVKGGAGKIIFGQGADPFSEVEVEAEKEKRNKKK